MLPFSEEDLRFGMLMSSELKVVHMFGEEEMPIRGKSPIHGCALPAG